MRFLWQSLKMALENLLRNKLVNFLCLGIIAFSLLVLGIFQVASHNLNDYIARISQNISAILYLREEVPSERIEELLARVQGGLLVAEARFVSAADAGTRFARDFPELAPILSEFKASPFPNSIEVRFKDEANILTPVESFLKEIRKDESVESLQLNTDWAQRIERVRELVSYVGYFLSFILIFVTVFVVFNVIKLNIVYRKDEIAIFRLVGARNIYIRLPFLIEGLILGTLGACLAGLLLFLALRLFAVYGGFLLDVVRGIVDIRRIPLAVYLRLVAIGAPIGFFSSFFSLQRFLHPKKPAA